MTKKQKKMRLRIFISALLLAGMMAADRLFLLPAGVRLAGYLIPYFVIGYDILRKAVLGIRNRQVFDENFLMAVATVGALALGEYSEGVFVMLFYQVGELFQSYAVGKSRQSIAALMDIRPDYANLEQDGQVVQVDPEEIAPGTLILVRPGEKIPLDGVVEEGSGSLDTSALTGESLPRSVTVGESVISGCIDLDGVLRIRTTKEFGESTVSKILDLVENSSMKKARTENFITHFARYYTPIVCYCALALALIPPLFLGNWGDWIQRALIFLVVSCPCALVISIPLTFFGGIGGASRAGILVKGSNYLEALSKADTVVFDKTGTLTKGSFQVAQIAPVPGVEESQLLEWAALAESFSNHPISKSLKAAWGKQPDQSRVSQVEELAGLGVTAQVDGRSLALGNLRLMEKVGAQCPPEHQEPGSRIHLALDGVYQGSILIADTLKPTAAAAISALKKLGVRQTVMLTGDSPAAAAAVAGELGLDSYHAQLLPAQKVERVEELLAQKPAGKTLAFVGDGINDAPVLSRADVGIAMGALGSDAAIEAADVVLMDDDPAKIALAIRICRKCMVIVWENIIFALGVKGVVLAAAALGLSNMWLAIFADVGVMVLAVLNSTRMLRVGKSK